MSNEKPSCQVLLFPLCDPSGALSEVLRDSTEEGTRLNALVLAWRLDLRKTVDVSAAAEALLTVAEANPRDRWSARQMRLVAELRRVSASKGGRPRADWQRILRRSESVKSRQRKTRAGRVSREPES